MSRPFWANIVVTDLELGNLFASSLDPDTGGAKTFGNLRLGSSSAGPVTAWAASTPLSPAGKLAFDEFAGAGPYPILTLMGRTPEEIAAAKAAFHVEYGERSSYEGRLHDYVAELGYAQIAAPLGELV